MDYALEKRLDFGGLDQMTVKWRSKRLHYLHDILSAPSCLALFLAHAW